MNPGQSFMIGVGDFSLKVSPIGQTTPCIYSRDGRIYRCRTCEEKSPLVHDGKELREWFTGHNCGE